MSLGVSTGAVVSVSLRPLDVNEDRNLHKDFPPEDGRLEGSRSRLSMSSRATSACWRHLGPTAFRRLQSFGALPCLCLQTEEWVSHRGPEDSSYVLRRKPEGESSLPGVGYYDLSLFSHEPVLPLSSHDFNLLVPASLSLVPQGAGT